MVVATGNKLRGPGQDPSRTILVQQPERNQEAVAEIVQHEAIAGKPIARRQAAQQSGVANQRTVPRSSSRANATGRGNGRFVRSGWTCPLLPADALPRAGAADKSGNRLLASASARHQRSLISLARGLHKLC